MEDSRIPRNPCYGVRLPKREHPDRGYLSHQQVVALASAVERQGEVVRFLAYTGLRWGEMAALRVQDFDMLRRRVNVSRSVTESGGLVWSTPKTWERRSVPFPAVLCAELAALMIGKGRDDLVFTDQRGGVLRNSNWRARVFRPAVTKCQSADETFPTITPHDLRHTAASLAVSAHANVKAVQRMLGHAKASMTLDINADLFDEDLDSVADRLDAAIKFCCGRIADGFGRLTRLTRPDLLKSGGAKGIRTPDLLDANESRYQLRHSPWSVAQATSQRATAETGRRGGDLLAGRPRQVVIVGRRGVIEVLEDRVLVVDLQHHRAGSTQP